MHRWWQQVGVPCVGEMRPAGWGDLVGPETRARREAAYPGWKKEHSQLALAPAAVTQTLKRTDSPGAIPWGSLSSPGAWAPPGEPNLSLCTEGAVAP